MIDAKQENRQANEKGVKLYGINRAKANDFVIAVKRWANGAYGFFRDNRNNSIVMLVIAIATTALAGYFGYQLYQDIQLLNAKTSQLHNLASYDIRAMESNVAMQGVLKSAETIDDLVQENIDEQSEITKYSDYLNALQLPYTYLLKYIYLPSLNVRKENYTDKIDTDLIGIKFLEKNPFNDITLLQKRGDFFKNLGDNNESNDVNDMSIGEIAEDANGYFSMPITVSFTANSKRAFLLLADKLSMTSNSENISLINEFFYYLWGEIKKGKAKEITTLENEYATIFGSGDKVNQDKVIGYSIYQRIFGSGQNVLIDDDIINKTIKSIISCNTDSDEVCYYKFRERYRNIPTFGYLLGMNMGSNGAENLKKFMQQLPPIFAIKEFEFDKIKSPTISDVTNTKYQGKVVIVVYGRSATSQEVDQIAKVLGAKCLGEEKPFTTSDGLAMVESAIAKLSTLSEIDKTYADNLRELKGIVEKLNEDYPKLSNYKKTIKLFELYRMLSEGGLCK